MYCIVRISGQQFQVEKGQKLYIPHLETPKGGILEIKDVLMLVDNSNINMQTENKKVILEVMDEVKGDKVIAFKMKRRKGFRKKKGHRTLYSHVLVKDII